MQFECFIVGAPYRVIVEGLHNQSEDYFAESPNTNDERDDLSEFSNNLGSSEEGRGNCKTCL